MHLRSGLRISGNTRTGHLNKLETPLSDKIVLAVLAEALTGHDSRMGGGLLTRKYSSFDPLGGSWHVLMLPNTNHNPAGLLQEEIGLRVALPILANFL